MEETVMFLQPIPPLVIALIIAGVVILLLILTKHTSGDNRTQWWLRLSVIACLAVASLRPSIPVTQPSETYNTNYDVYFVVDLTSSMNAEDWGQGNTTRLDGIRADINNLLDDYAGAKYSLITFNSTATPRVPLTTDSSAIATSVNTMNTEVTRYSKGSSISEPVNLLTTTLQQDAEENPNRARIVLYFGDGEQTVNETPNSFDSIRPFIKGGQVYGYGTEQGGKMKVQTGSYVTAEDKYIQDGNGVDGVSVIDETNLQNIATQIGGDYEHRTPDKRITPYAVDANTLRDLTIATTGSSINTVSELYWIPLAPAAALIGVELLFSWKRMQSLGYVRGRKDS